MLVFANPAFLWAMAAAAIPLMLHMFQRRRTVVTPFPTLRFLKAAQKRSSSRVRFENILLWLVRTLLLLALAMAFALPVIRTITGDSLLSRTRRDVAIVIDSSYSMNYELDRGKVLTICKDAAVNIVSGLFSGDRVCLYLAGDSPQPVIEKLTSEHATVIQAINALECLPGSSQLDQCVALALRALDEREGGRRERELYILTDGQRLAWRGFSERASGAEPAATSSEENPRMTREQLDATSFFVLLAGAQQPENSYPIEVKLSPSLLLTGQNARLNARIGRSGPAQDVTVTLEVNEVERGRRSLNLAADSDGHVEFALGALEAGTHVGTVRTGRDALAEDDAFNFLIRVRQQLPALIVGDKEASRYLKAALAPGASSESVKEVSGAELTQLDLRAYQAVFLCDALPLEGQAIMRLEEYVKSGGVLIIFPGYRADNEAYAAFNILPALPTAIHDIPAENSPRPLRRIPHQEGQVVNFNLALPAGSVPIVALKKILRLGPLQEQAAVLINAADEPLMTGRSLGRGRVFLFTIGATREWSTLPLTAFFLPMVHQLIRQGAGASLQPPYLLLNTQMEVIEAISDYREDDQITAPSGKPLQIKDGGNRTLFIELLEEPGIYPRLRAGATVPEPALAVNAERSESDLTRASAPEIEEWSRFKKLFIAQDPEELERLIDEYRNGRSLAELLLWLALLLSLLEWWGSCRAMRSRIGATEKMRVDLAGRVSGSIN